MTLYPHVQGYKKFCNALALARLAYLFPDLRLLYWLAASLSPPYLHIIYTPLR